MCSLFPLSTVPSPSLFFILRSGCPPVDQKCVNLCPGITSYLLGISVQLFSSLSSSKPPSRIMVHIQNIPNLLHPVGIVFIRAFTELPGFFAALCDVAAPVCSPAVSFVGRCVVRESAWPFSSLDFFLRTRSLAFQPISSTVVADSFPRIWRGRFYPLLHPRFGS